MDPKQCIQRRGSNETDAFSRLRLSFLWQINKQITQRHSDRRPKPETAVGTQTKHKRNSKHFPQFNAWPNKTTKQDDPPPPTSTSCQWLHLEEVTALPVKCHADGRGPKKVVEKSRNFQIQASQLGGVGGVPHSYLARAIRTTVAAMMTVGMPSASTISKPLAGVTSTTTRQPRTGAQATAAARDHRSRRSRVVHAHRRIRPRPSAQTIAALVDLDGSTPVRTPGGPREGPRSRAHTTARWPQRK